MNEQQKKALDYIFDTLRGAVEHAITKHPTPFHNAHEALGVSLEEWREYEAEVFAQTLNPANLEKEALHCAAMGVRTILDVTLKHTRPELLTTDPFTGSVEEVARAEGQYETLREIAANANCAEVDVGVFARLGVELMWGIRGNWPALATKPASEVMVEVKRREQRLRRELSQSRKDVRALKYALKTASVGWNEAQREVEYMTWLCQATADAVLKRQHFLRVPRATDPYPNGMNLPEAVAQGFDDLKVEIDDLRDANQTFADRAISKGVTHAEHADELAKSRALALAFVHSDDARVQAESQVSFYKGEAQRARDHLNEERAEVAQMIDELRLQIADLKRDGERLKHLNDTARIFWPDVADDLTEVELLRHLKRKIDELTQIEDVSPFVVVDRAQLEEQRERSEQMEEVMNELTFTPDDPQHITRMANRGELLSRQVAIWFSAQAAPLGKDAHPSDVLHAVASMNAELAKVFAEEFPAYMQDNGGNNPNTFDPAASLRRIAFDIDLSQKFVKELEDALNNPDTGLRPMVRRLHAAAGGAPTDDFALMASRITSTLDFADSIRKAFDDYIPQTLKECDGDHRVALAQYVRNAKEAYSERLQIDALFRSRAALDGKKGNVEKARFAIGELVRLQGIEAQVSGLLNQISAFTEVKTSNFPHLRTYGALDGLRQGIHELRAERDSAQQLQVEVKTMIDAAPVILPSADRGEL